MACGKETSVPNMAKPATSMSVEEQNHDQTWDAPDYVHEDVDQMTNEEPKNQEKTTNVAPEKPIKSKKGRACHIIPFRGVLLG